MPKPGAAAVVDEEPLDTNDEGVDDGDQDEANQTDGDENPIGNGGANPDEGAEGEEGADVDGEAEGEIPEPEVDLGEENRKLKERLDKLENKETPQQHPAQVEFTKEQWAEFEDNTGVSKQNAVFTSRMVANAINALEKKFEDRLADLTQDEHVSALSTDPRFKDAKNYKDEITGYLKNFNPEYRKDPKIREQAYFYAKGKSASKNIKKVVAQKERDRKIIGKAPSRPGLPAKAKPSMRLTDAERRAASSAGMTEAEYMKAKTSSIDELAG